MGTGARTIGLVAWLALAAIAGAVPVARAAPAPIAPRGAVGATAERPMLSVDPETWWLESGGNLTLSAAWIDVPAGCVVAAIWFRWSVGPGSAAGTLDTTNGSSVTFDATDQGSGTAEVTVRSAASVACSGNASAAFSRANATVTVAAPLDVTDLAVTPDPVPPNATAAVRGDVVGGTPPYRLWVGWGAGAASSASIAAPGAFSVAASFADAGTYAPELVVTDAAGDSVEARPPEALNVSATFAAAIAPSTPVAEEGVPVVFTIQTAEAPPSFSLLFGCEDAVPASAGNASGLAYGCSFSSPGLAPVWFEGVGTSAPFPIATASLEESVVPPPTVALPPSSPVGEVGATILEPVTIAGGVPPFALAWSLVGANIEGTASAATDGVDFLPLTSGVAGSLQLSVVVTDALGVVCTAAAGGIAFEPSLGLQANALARPAAGALWLNVSASVVEGSPPLDWTVVPSLPAEGASPSAGLLDGAGAFGWNATYAPTGELRLAIVVVDASGVAATTNLTVSLALAGDAAGIAGASGPAEGAAALVVVIAAAAAGVVLVRRRRPAASAAPPDPVATLREVIEPSDGVDRGLVETLAEERGVPLELVRSTLERLKADGTVRYGRGADGEEVLAWSRPYEP